MSSIDAYMVETINLIINYLKEREEPAPTPVVEEWQNGEVYFFIDDYGDVEESCWWSDELDVAHRDFMGIFATRAAAQEKLAKITKVLGE